MRDRRARPVGSRRRARDHAPTRAEASVESIEDSTFGFEPARGGGGFGAAARASPRPLKIICQLGSGAAVYPELTERSEEEAGVRRARAGRVLAPSGYLFEGA